MQLTYKGREAFNTAAGGCCSIALMLAIATVFALDIHNGFTKPVYVRSSETEFARYATNEDPFVMSTQN